MELKLTPSGQELLQLALIGEATINFIAIQLGNGADGGKDATVMSNPLLTVDLSDINKEGIFVTLKAAFSNSEVTSGFRCTEIGVLVKDPDNDDGTLLYAYSYTKETAADYIPAGSDRILETQMDVLVYIGNAENVTASISESLVYASQEELEAHVEDRSNPHHVTAEQVGLGNVPNVSTDDQTPTYTVASSLTDLTSGEKLSVSFGKIAKAISNLISHLTNTANPHKVTAKQMGAAKESHQHSTPDITSGTLGVARGGTGKGSWTANRLAYPSAAAAFSQLPFPTSDGMFLRQNKSGAPYWAAGCQTGTYLGQGRTGSGAMSSLTFSDGLPKIVFIQEKTNYGRWGMLLLNPTVPCGMSVADGVTSMLTVTVSGNTVSWYYNSTESHPANQLDTKGVTHVYVGIF